jgi:hypothetical protein
MLAPIQFWRKVSGVFLMHHGLNDNQLRRVTVSLAQVEQALRSTEEILARSREDLFKTVRIADDPERRREAEALIIVVRNLLLVAFARFDLLQSDEDGARVARAAFTVAWAGVEEIRSRRLSGYGAVDPSLQSSLDPLVDELSRLLLHLAHVFDEWPAAT